MNIWFLKLNPALFSALKTDSFKHQIAVKLNTDLISIFLISNSFRNLSLTLKILFLKVSISTPQETSEIRTVEYPLQ